MYSSPLGMSAKEDRGWKKAHARFLAEIRDTQFGLAAQLHLFNVSKKTSVGNWAAQSSTEQAWPRGRGLSSRKPSWEGILSAQTEGQKQGEGIIWHLIGINSVFW